MEENKGTVITSLHKAKLALKHSNHAILNRYPDWKVTEIYPKLHTVHLKRGHESTIAHWQEGDSITMY